MLADILIPWSATTTWLLGALGALTLFWIIISTINQARKLWGRKPPMDEQISALDKSIRREIKAGDEALQDQLDEVVQDRIEHHAQIERTIGAISNKIEDLKTDFFADGARRTEATNVEIRKLAVAIGRLDERTSGGTQIQV
jgi:16S rRNA U516 pseudouridylate synthase RsuA-like enzyme